MSNHEPKSKLLLEELTGILNHMNNAVDRSDHNKKCWWCAECGDDLGKAATVVRKLEKVIT